MISDVKNYPISQLFDIESNVIYAIPPYQREYTWAKREWEALFDDIVESDSAYFLGSIICINQTKDALATQRLEMVDGQQRMTTISIFFVALYAVLKEYGDELDDDQKVEIINLKRRIVSKRGNDQLRVIPQIHNYNKDDYCALLALNGIIKKINTPPNAGNRKIFRCYRYFQEQIREYAKSNISPLASILELLNRFLMASLVKIEVVTHSDAYTLFESLNNRGIPLTPIDLIKNKLLAQLDQQESNSIERHFNNWRTLLDCLGDDYSVQERFFRQYYNGFKRSLSQIIQIPLATKSNLIMIYEKIIQHDAIDFMDKMIEAGKLYAVIIGRNIDEDLQSELESLTNPLKNLERIQGAPSYLMLLHLLWFRSDYKLTTTNLVAIIDLLSSFFVRRNLTDMPPTRDLNRLFMTTIDKLVNLSGIDVVQAIRKELIEVSADDTIFRTKLMGPVYEDNSGVTRFILCAIAEQGMTKETKLDLWKLDGKQYLWTIEHIFPQGDNIPTEWINVIAGGDSLKAKDYQNIYVHKFGNLTISGFNSSLGNKSFIEKRDRKDKEGNFVGYKNGLKLNESIAMCESWSISQIEERTSKLVDQAVGIFDFDENIA